MEKNDGGPAFPSVQSATEYSERAQGYIDRAVTVGGMSLRDYFAGQALPQAIEHERANRAASISPGDFRYDKVAAAAYVIADAMLEAREKQ